MEKNVQISMLCEIYGKLLTKKQLDILENYYDKDLSLSEIAENEKITRQAVRDNLKNGENNLLEYESRLGLMEKTLSQEKSIEEILKQIEEVNEKDAMKLLQTIKTKLRNLF